MPPPFHTVTASITLLPAEKKEQEVK